MTITFPPVSKVIIGVFYTCNWYDEGASTWSPEGCVTAIDFDGSIQCTCNHLTSFAVLAEVSSASLSNQGEDAPIDSADAKALSTIT